MEIEMISSSSNPKIKQVVLWQNKSKERKKEEVFLAEGLKMFEEAPLSMVKEVYLTQRFLDKCKQHQDILHKLNHSGYDIVTEEIFQKIADTKTPQGILTVLKQPKYEIEQLLCAENSMFLILEDIQDPGNLGTIVRTGEGAGISAIIMTGKTVDIYNPKVIRSTMGSIYRVPHIYIEETKEAILRVQEKSIKVYAAHLSGREFYEECFFTEGIAFLIGNEGNGLKEETVAFADSLLKIPMEGKLESLNASVAASILMYEAYRQRRNHQKNF